MLTNIEKQFSILFFIIVLIEILTGSTETLKTAHYIAKPAIVISLIFLFINRSKSLSKPIKNLTISALVFSLIGDVLLLFVDKSEHFFTIGLIAFLLAHVMYIILFLKHRNKENSPYGFIILILVYGASLFYFLKDGLGTMLIPVAVYMIVILTMATTAYLRKNNVNIVSYGLVFLGALLFMASDSILALNKFNHTIPWSNISIIVTYALAQYLIIIGILKISVTK
ncbi:lysoplasmalogenase [Winogradskyella sp. UBA3174]|uniref:lysoplasmalogenase n=1 Tax=Winogradskyella sp. UBA3174 TaxID=1947785 RepID=UPI0025E2F9EA|nr:lysoplasmalogenase [Winogradskyella sp. UBA3174]|tara:strand:+ start:13908 stop:14585 length:678 start_codon:yes stop_codon:yes gene_type:complete